MVLSPELPCVSLTQHCTLSLPAGTSVASLPGATALDMPVPPGIATGSAEPSLARLAQDRDRVRQLLAAQLLQMHAPQAQRSEVAAWQRARQLELAGEQQHSAAPQHLYLGGEVAAMLAQRASLRHLGALVGDQERLQHMARLELLNQQLAVAQARKLALRQQSEQQQQQARPDAGMAAAVEQSAAAEQQLKEHPINLFAVQPSLVSDVSAAFCGGLAPRLGPPPPLPGAHSARPVSAGGQERGSFAASVLQQWRTEAQRAAAAVPSSWEPRMAQRAASARMPWDPDLKWATA